ncbi:thiamine pyrophosphate-binding protein [Geodermatophilus sp. SYSU D00703]
MTARALAQSLAEGLSAAGVRKIFGMPGGGPSLDMIGAAADLGIDFVLAHGETAACIMAASYGRLTRTPGVAVVTRGPGLTSAGNGLAQATLDRFPLVLVSDAVSHASADRVAHQRLDQIAAAAPLTKWSGTLGTGDPAWVAAAAAVLALTAPAGAVHLAFDPTVPGDPAPQVPVRPSPPDAAALASARELLARASRPVVVIGVDAASHPLEVRTTLRTFDAPVLTTYEAKGTVPESWPTYAGLFTGAVIERALLEQADLILGLGLDPVEPMPGAWAYDAPVVLLHSHPVETAFFGAPVLVTGDYGELLPELLAGCRPKWPTGIGAEMRRGDLDRLEWASDRLTPHDVVRTTQAVLGDVTLTVDAGAHMLVAMPLWQTDEPDSVLISNGLATMGFALPAAIAAALAKPGRRVVCFVGDGGLGMVLAELETLARLHLDVIVVVFNDATLTLIELKQTEGQGGRGAVGYRTVDFAGIATAMGVPGVVVHEVQGLAAALTQPGAGPRLVDARVDPSAYPHVIRTIRG